jgi:hypothetical protein
MLEVIGDGLVVDRLCGSVAKTQHDSTYAHGHTSSHQVTLPVVHHPITLCKESSGGFSALRPDNYW